MYVGFSLIYLQNLPHCPVVILVIILVDTSYNPPSPSLRSHCQKTPLRRTVCAHRKLCVLRCVRTQLLIYINKIGISNRFSCIFVGHNLKSPYLCIVKQKEWQVSHF